MLPTSNAVFAIDVRVALVVTLPPPIPTHPPPPLLLTFGWFGARAETLALCPAPYGSSASTAANLDGAGSTNFPSLGAARCFSRIDLVDCGAGAVVVAVVGGVCGSRRDSRCCRSVSACACALACARLIPPTVIIPLPSGSLAATGAAAASSLGLSGLGPCWAHLTVPSFSFELGSLREVDEVDAGSAAGVGCGGPSWP